VIDDCTQPASPAANLRGVGQAYMLLVASGLLIVTFGSVAQLASPRIGLAFTEVGLILLPALVYVRTKNVAFREAFRLRPTPITTILAGVLLGVTGWGVAIGIYLLSVPLLGKGPKLEIFDPKTLSDLLILLPIFSVLPGVCEEILFRGTVQGILERKGPWRAVIYTSILFGVFHLNPWNLVPATFLGFVLGVLALRTGSILPSMVAHASVNATALVAAYLFRDRSLITLVNVLSIGFIVAFGTFLYQTRRRETVLPRLARVPAGLSRRFVVTVLLGGLPAGVLLLAAFVAGIYAFLGAYSMTSDAMEPEIHKGDRVITLKTRFPGLKIGTGDTIVFLREGRPLIRKVVRRDAEQIWIKDGAREVAVPRTSVAGKVIIPSPK
jgi:membrane protease YdiL (CAAX protease family)